MGAEFKPILTTSNKISGEGAIDYAAGQILFTIDTKQIYIDDNNYNRLSWSYISKYSDGQNDLGLLVGNGEENEASGQNSTIVNGSYNVASGNGAVILGGNPESGEQNPVGNTASGDYSLVAGNKNTASGDYAFAAGYKTQATGDYSVALGNNTVANENNEVVIGYYNKQNQTYIYNNTTYTDPNDYLFIVGNGTNLAPSNIMEVTTDKIITRGNFIIGVQNGDAADSPEQRTTITGNNSGTIGSGRRQTIIGDNSIIIGGSDNNTILQNNGAIIASTGTNTIGSNDQSLNYGYCNTIIGSISSSVIGLTQAILASRSSIISDGQNCAIISGYQAQASGSYSVAIGNRSKVKGNYCLAIGEDAEAIPQPGEVETNATHRYAIGDNVKSGHTNEFVIGKYNEIPTNACLFVIGNGTNNANSNIVEVETDNVNIKSTMKVIDTLSAHLNLDWTASDSYKVGDLVINNLHLYRCKTANNDSAFDNSNWDQIT